MASAQKLPVNTRNPEHFARGFVLKGEKDEDALQNAKLTPLPRLYLVFLTV